LRRPIREAELFPNSMRPRAAIWRDVHASRLKLFVLSLLWRAHASSLRAFLDVDLGPFEKQLRSFLQRDDPGSPDEFAVFLTRTVNRPSGQVGIPPVKCRLQGRPNNINVYRMHLHEHELVVKMDSRKYSESLRSVQLSPGQPVVVLLDEFLSSNEAKLLRNFFRRRRGVSRP